MDDRSFYGQWIVANGLSEAAGLGTTFMLGSAVAPFIEERPGAAAILGTAALAVLLGTLLEGVVVGWAQMRVLHRRRGDIAQRSWVLATAIGAGLAWMIAMIPSSATALAAPAPAVTPAEEPTFVLAMVLAAGLGLATGPILGVAQWVVLRRHVRRAGSWLWANAVAWTLGMPVIFAGMDFVPFEGSAVQRATAVYAVCLLAGLVVGAVHGAVLVRLTKKAPTSSDRPDNFPGPPCHAAGSQGS